MASEDVKLCFALFDKSNAGSISKEDAATALRTLGKAPSSEELEVFNAFENRFLSHTPSHVFFFGDFQVSSSGVSPFLKSLF